MVANVTTTRILLDNLRTGRPKERVYNRARKRIRASQINGCAYCIVMHTNDARKHGESDEWMHLLNAWREAPIYSARERAALAWTGAVTKVSDGHVPNEVYDEARKHFSEEELVDLTAAVIAINAWNRAAIAFRATPPLTSTKIAA
jgi:AhpD family alkylhydroperoxidase